MASDGLEPPFARPVLIGLVAVGACSMALALGLLIAGPEQGVVASAGADSFSHSALGHSAFVELLHARGVPVMVSRYASAERAGSRALLLLAEPRLGDSGRERRLRAMLESTHSVLIVLPKWTGREDPQHAGWLKAVRRLHAEVRQAVLAAAAVPATLADPAGVDGVCEGSTARLTLPQPQLLVSTSPDLRPLISCPGGVLLAEITRDGRRLVVLSDPDAIANHALGQADHAQLALDVVERARHPGQTVVVDETLHGHERVPSLWRELFAFPLLPAVVQAGLALLFFVYSGLGRFGAPLRPPPAFASGKSVLIDNTAALLRTAGHSAYTLGRYFEDAVADVGRALHAPALGPSEMVAWLRGLGRRRGAATDLLSLHKQVENARRAEVPSAAAIVAAARRTHRWRQEMLRGPEDHPGR